MKHTNYISVRELNGDQKRQLKIHFREELDGKPLSYYEMANIDDIVSDGEIYSYYKDTAFVDEDFW